MIYGPNTEAVQSIIDRIPTLTEDECNRLEAAWAAAWDAARDANRYAAMSAADGAARYATWDAARDAGWYATRDAARYAIRYATRYAAIDAYWAAARDAILTTVTYDLATETGSYTIAHRDLLLAPWIEVCGMPEGLIATAGFQADNERE